MQTDRPYHGIFSTSFVKNRFHNFFFGTEISTDAEHGTVPNSLTDCISENTYYFGAKEIELMSLFIAPIRSYTLHAVKNTDFWSCMNEQQEQRLLNYGMDLVGMTGMCFHNRHM